MTQRRMQFRLIRVGHRIGEDLRGFVDDAGTHGDSSLTGLERNSFRTAVTVASSTDDGKPTMTRSITPSQRWRIAADQFVERGDDGELVKDLVVDQGTHLVPAALQ